MKIVVNVICVFIFLAFLAIPLSAQTSQEALTKCQNHLTRLKTLDYTFKYAAYYHPVRFRSSGIMTRCDYDFPVRGSNGKAFVRYNIMAFNGSIYQNKSIGSMVMSCTHEPWSEPGKCGPCWTPLEYTFKWCQTRKEPLTWQSLHDDSTWKRMRELADPEVKILPIEIGGKQIKCARVIIRRPVGSVSHVYLAVDKGYLPIKHEVFSSDGNLGSVMLVKNLLEITGEDGQEPVCFPIDIIAFQPKEKGERFKDNFNVKYQVEPESLSINQKINKEIFTLDYAGEVNVYLNAFQVYLPDEDRIVWVGE